MTNEDKLALVQEAIADLQRMVASCTCTTEQGESLAETVSLYVLLLQYIISEDETHA